MKGVVWGGGYCGHGKEVTRVWWEEGSKGYAVELGRRVRTNNVNVRSCYALGGSSVYLFGNVELTEGGKPGHHVLIGQYQDAHRVSLLYGGVVSIQVLQEG